MDTRDISRVLAFAERINPRVIVPGLSEMLEDAQHLVGLIARVAFQVGFNRGYLEGRSDEAHGRPHKPL
jgi:hypothetical protein